MKHPARRETAAMLERARRLASYLSSEKPEPVSRTHLDGLHRGVVSAAVELGVVVALNDDGRKPAALERLNEAEQAYWSAMDRALPVGGRDRPAK